VNRDGQRSGRTGARATARASSYSIGTIQSARISASCEVRSTERTRLHPAPELVRAMGLLRYYVRTLDPEQRAVRPETRQSPASCAWEGVRAEEANKAPHVQSAARDARRRVIPGGVVHLAPGDDPMTSALRAPAASIARGGGASGSPRDESWELDKPSVVMGHAMMGATAGIAISLRGKPNNLYHYSYGRRHTCTNVLAMIGELATRRKHSWRGEARQETMRRQRQIRECRSESGPARENGNTRARYPGRRRLDGGRRATGRAAAISLRRAVVAARSGATSAARGGRARGRVVALLPAGSFTGIATARVAAVLRPTGERIGRHARRRAHRDA
jgi:hypothetical protein